MIVSYLSIGIRNVFVVPGAGLEPATFGCLRQSSVRLLRSSTSSRGAVPPAESYPMSPTRYQLRHPGDASGTGIGHLSVSVPEDWGSHPQG